MEKAFENNEVLLWGLKPVRKSLLDKYNIGNKNPHSKKKPKEEVQQEQPKQPKKKREFEIDEDYGVKDIEFLNNEYERIEKEMMRKDLTEEENEELEEKQDKLYDLIEGLEHLNRLQGKGISNTKDFDDLDDDFIGSYINKPIVNSISIGKGFKKGSPEALEHAKKMREAIEKKKKQEGIIKKDETKARVAKGSEQAKELGKRLAEAKRKKREALKAIENEKKNKEEENKQKEKHGKLKPWFYIGEIPKGYREATEDEAILNRKISEYGKYIVDEQKWNLFDKYNILLSDDKTDKEIIWTMNGLKRRIMQSLKEIEILDTKFNNPKYHEEREDISDKLTEEKINRKYLQAGWNWYYKILCEKTGKKYERQKFQLDKYIPKQTENKPLEFKPFPKSIDTRTGKPVQTREEIKEEEKKENEPIEFIKGKDIIELKRKYFNEDLKLYPKYSKQLFEKGIVLDIDYYSPEDFKKHLYVMKITGEGIFKRL